MDKATMYLRGIHAHVAREAKAAAAREGLTLTAFVERAIERETRRARRAPEGLSEIAADMEWYEANRKRLLRRYEGEHLVIIGGEVVDHDADLEALARRVDERYGVRSIYMPQCVRAPRVVDIRSPRTAG